MKVVIHTLPVTCYLEVFLILGNRFYKPLPFINFLNWCRIEIKQANTCPSYEPVIFLIVIITVKINSNCKLVILNVTSFH